MRKINEELYGDYIDDQLILVDVETLLNEYGHSEVTNNLRGYIKLSDDEKMVWFNEFRDNFKRHFDESEWESIYQNHFNIYLDSQD